jgi:hypothetical protein
LHSTPPASTSHSPGGSVVPDSEDDDPPQACLLLCLDLDSRSSSSPQNTPASTLEFPSWTHLPVSGSSDDEDDDEGASVLSHRLPFNSIFVGVAHCFSVVQVALQACKKH